MTFQVPQFLDVEDKIFFGVLTVKQLGFFAGAFALTFLTYKIAGFIGGVLIGIITFGLAFAVSFVKINGRNLTITLQAIVNYWTKPQVYVWHPGEAHEAVKERIEKVVEKARTPQEKIINLKNAFKEAILPSKETKKIPSNIHFDEPSIKSIRK